MKNTRAWDQMQVQTPIFSQGSTASVGLLTLRLEPEVGGKTQVRILSKPDSSAKCRVERCNVGI